MREIIEGTRVKWKVDCSPAHKGEIWEVKKERIAELSSYGYVVIDGPLEKERAVGRIAIKKKHLREETIIESRLEEAMRRMKSA